MSHPDLPNSYRQNFEKLKSQIKDASHGGLRSRSLSFIEEFAYTYLRSLSALSQIKANPHWHRYLQPCQKSLIEANVLLYPEESARLKDMFHLIWTKVPAQIWSDRYFHLASLAICCITAGLAFMLVTQNFELATLFIPPGLRSSYELEAYLFSTDAQHEMLTAGQDFGLGQKSMFATFLMINNIRVALLCFVSGFLFGVPTFILLVNNGFMLGTLPALFAKGDLVGLGAWLLPHGVPEISAIILAGGAGLKIGMTMLNPGEDGMALAMGRTVKAVAATVIIFVVLLIWAAFVESFVRQSKLSYEVRYIIAAVSCVPLILLFLRGYLAHRSLKPGKPSAGA